MKSQIKSGEMSEKEALERVRSGDAEGMSRLYELYKPRIYALFLHHTGNAFDAEDLTHEVFIQVFRKLFTFRGEAAFKSWIYKIALNFSRLHFRRQRRRNRLIVPDAPEEAQSSTRTLFRNPAQGVALMEALSTLTTLRRTAFVLCDIQGLTHVEAAARMGVSVIASKSRLHQAHVAIRSILRSRGPSTNQS